VEQEAQRLAEGYQDASALARIKSLKRRIRMFREHLLLANIKLIASIARKHADRDTDRDDLMSIGTVAVLEAIDAFEPERGNRFSTYATTTIRNAYYDRYRAVGEGRVVTVAAPEAIIEGDATDKCATLPLHNGKPMPKPWLRVLRDWENHEAQVDTLVRLLGGLAPRDEEILTLRFALDGNPAHTLQSVGIKYGISKQAVRKIEARSITLLQKQVQLHAIA
jgi:RNA polymerase sigma factor (sigma-70 family)